MRDNLISSLRCCVWVQCNSRSGFGLANLFLQINLNDRLLVEKNVQFIIG